MYFLECITQVEIYIGLHEAVENLVSPNNFFPGRSVRTFVNTVDYI